MDWNGNNLRVLPPLVSRQDTSSLSFLYNHNYDHYPGVEMMKYPVLAGQAAHVAVGGGGGVGKSMMMRYNNQKDKKKRLSSEQLDSLESSFQDEIKLDPERKLRLARELGLQPRQVAIWFQNRRTRWKAKHLEQLYDGLKHEFDAVSREKQKLQEEVVALRAMIKDQAMKNQVSTEISGEDTVESTSVGNRGSGKPPGATLSHDRYHHHQMPDKSNNNTFFNVVDDYNSAMPPPYWGTILPSYP
ncbi:Homeobox-leucine zipper protein like [Actinidia chinensis var. chinensis]|uniref:Homeobox-leucine zipper protein n=1 Tax=Actinidia chinensis var. chinensis TaxID=1590841 RepID=A0A2R6RY16_ACTCC|nr:Homeobox-leucine zipper protein like [Actinidia chinensis var. chinensis]